MKFVLFGTVATMDSTFAVLANGAIYVDGNVIVAVADRAAPPPAGFAGATLVDTGGIIRTKPGPRLDPTRLSGNGKRNVAAWPELPRPSSTLPLTS